MEIPITKDIRKFKTKDVGNFSFKEAGFIAGAGAIGFFLYKMTENLYVTLPPAAIILVFGFFKPFGLSFWTFIKTFVKERFLTPPFLPNESDFEYDEECFEPYKDEYDIDAVMAAIQADVTVSNIKRDKSDLAQLCR